MWSFADVIEAHHAFAVTDHRLAINDAGSRSQPSHGFHDQREAVCQVVTGAAVEPHFHAVLAGDHPKAVVLDFMQPQRPKGGCWALVGRQGGTKPAGETRIRRRVIAIGADQDKHCLKMAAGDPLGERVSRFVIP
jgi:hypothetical protein